MKKTPLYDKTVQSGAKIVDFHGWAMPLQYQGILSEAVKTRTHLSLCDVSHMAQIRIKGNKALEFLQRLIPNDVARLDAGQVQYNLLLSEKATIIDDFMIYHCGESFLCVVNAANREKDMEWLFSHNTDNVEIVDESEKKALLSLQGPEAHLVMKKIFGDELIEQMPYMGFTEVLFEKENCLISRTGYTGEDGFEVYVERSVAPTLWDEIIRYGKAHELVCAGLGARDILRIEVGYCLWGNDINESTNPYEAGLGWVVKSDKDFIGKSLLVDYQKNSQRRRIGFIMREKGVPRKGYQLCDGAGKSIGEVTSGTYSAYLGEFIGMGYISSSYNTELPIFIKIRDRLCQGRLAPLPFVPFCHKSKKLAESRT